MHFPTIYINSLSLKKFINIGNNIVTLKEIIMSGKNYDSEALRGLDKESSNIGMGGYQSKDSTEKKYKQRMSRRKEVQELRIKERDQEKGLIIVFTGHGKGKTTASLGMALRTLGHGGCVAIIQFIKGGWESGEAKALKEFGERMQWHSLGEGFTWETQDRERDKELAEKAWRKAMTYLKNKSYKLVILDEINIAIKLNYLELESVIKGIQNRPKLTHVVLTGRDAKNELIDIADLVTEMKLLHHPFKEQGVKAQKGIEY